MKRLMIFFLMMMLSQYLSAQDASKSTSEHNIIFRDTIGLLVFDSSRHRLQTVLKSGQFSIVKHFKNIGKTPVIITQAFTSDPHFICEYPHEPMIQGKVYPFKVCFTFNGSSEDYRWKKTMGFVLSDESKISLHFEGDVKAEKRD